MPNFRFPLQTVMAMSLLALTLGCSDSASNPASTADATSLPDEQPSIVKTTENDATKTGTPSTEPTDSSDKGGGEPNQAIAPGNYCFEVNDSDTSGFAIVEVAADRSVFGSVDATIHNEAEAYYTSYKQDLVGNLQGTQLTLDLTTQIELDTQNTQETWTLTEEVLDTGIDSFTRVGCTVLNPPSPSQDFQVQFNPGTSIGILSNAVVRGDRDTYLLNAGAGQVMEVQISSLEDNAAFDVIAPDGSVLAQEFVDDRIPLPVSGNYQISVGGTRGNAIYQLRVEIN